MHPATDAASPKIRALPLRPPAHRVHPRAIRWWQLRAAVTLLVTATPQIIGAVLAGPGIATLFTATTIATVVAAVIYAVVVPPWLYRNHRWEITDQAVYTLSGWLVREWRIAPVSRVQTVDTQRGPIQQLLGLATVTVTTASARGPVKISGLTADDAAELARVLTERTHATPGDAT